MDSRLVCKGAALLSAALWLAPAFSAQTGEAEQGPRLDALLEEWREVHGSSWRLASILGTGHANYLYGGSVAATFVANDDAEYFELARGSFADAQPLMGIDVDTLVDERVVLLPLGTAGGRDKIAVRFRQAVRGVPVVRGHASALFHVGGELLALDTTGLPNLTGFDTHATRSADDALLFAVETFFADTGTAPTEVGVPRLVVDQERADKVVVPALAWEVRVMNETPGFAPEGYLYRVAAKDVARITSRQDEVHYFDVGGSVVSLATPGVLPDTGTNPEQPFPMAYMTVTSPQGNTVTDANGNFNIPGASGPLNVTFRYDGTFNDVDNDAGTNYTLTTSLSGTGNLVTMNPSGTATITSQANAFHIINVQRDWTRATNPSDSTSDFVADANVNINSSCNAFFNGSSTNYYLAGGSCVNTAYSTVIAHEMGHWLNVLYGSGNGPDGFGEGNADVFAMYLFDTPIVGQNFSGPGGHIRNGTNLRQYCGDSNPGCYSGVHANGEVHMGALWKVRANLKTSLGTSIGGAYSDLLFNGWMNAYNQGQIHSIVEIQWLTLDDVDGNIDNGTPNYNAINDAFLVQGYPGFELSFVDIGNVTALPDTQDEVGPYGVAADLTALFAPSVQSARVLVSVDGGPFVPTPMSHYSGSTWTALVGGIASPARVSYYVEGTDSNGDSNESAVQSFRVGVSNVFYSEDFEGPSDAGWTHAQVATQDDWQRGTPSGKSGTSLGVSWQDPSAAASGLNNWGNDLGPSGFNGAYQPNVNNFLRSPFIDLSSATGTTLEFQRWLNVEEAAFDQATISVNGVQVWQNPVSGHITETSWNLFSLDISAQADGNPAAQIEFRLQSDGGLELGGWNIDDFTLLSFQPSPGTCVPGNYGSGLPGTGGITPAIDTAGQQSQIGNADHKVVVKNGLPEATALIGFGQGAVSVPIFGGTLLVNPFQIFTQSLDIFGQTEVPLPIPNDPGLVGTSFFFQAFVIDPAAPSGISMTPGLQATLCN